MEEQQKLKIKKYGYLKIKSSLKQVIKKAAKFESKKSLDGPMKFLKGNATKAKKSFPDVSGDGKVTKKDVLIAKGVIPKKKK